MKTYVEFRTDLFPAYADEQYEINPGRFGKRLAEFLATHLRLEGFEVEEPSAEDWGWILRIKNNTFPIWIGCGNYDEYENGFLCFIEPHKERVRRLLRSIDTREPIGKLRDAMNRILTANDAISNVRWRTHSEING